MKSLEAHTDRVSVVANAGPAKFGVIAAGALAVAATGAQANGTDPADTLQIIDIDQTAVVGGGPIFIDINGDEFSDFSIETSVIDVVDLQTITFGAPETARITALDESAFIFGGGFGFAERFEAGDNVGEFEGKPFFVKSALLFDDFANPQGPFAEVGDTGFIGVGLSDDGVDFFGWLQITRGSVQVGQAGFQPNANVVAPIPNAVPVPPTLALLATGAIGLGALARRRRKQA